MPEGDSVYRQCKMLREALEGSVIVSSDFRVPSLATSDVSGRTVVAVVLGVWRLVSLPSFDTRAGRHLRSWWQRWRCAARAARSSGSTTTSCATWA